MAKKLKRWEIAGFIFVVALGSLGHFLYDLTGQNPLVGKFFAVNESTWEHLKLLFFPYVLFLLVEWFFAGKNYKSFAFSKTLGVLAGMLFIVALFYTYTGVLGRSVDFLNIIIFVLGTALSFFVSYKILSGGSKAVFKLPSVVILLVIAVAFIAFTTTPPEIGLFRDPVTGNFGVQAKNHQ